MPPNRKVTEPLAAHSSAHPRSSWLSCRLFLCLSCRLYLCVLAIHTAGCRPPAREYELRGVVVSVRADQNEITIKHDDIPRFMPGMTMPFKVRERELLRDRVPGDVVRATLVVQDADAYLLTLERTGSAPVPAEAAVSLPHILDRGEEIPDATFIDQFGARRRLSEWRGQALGVTFTYTRCPLPNFCPLMDQHFRRVQDTIVADSALRGQVHLLSISFDPDYDRPPVLAAHARQLGANTGTWSFLTGEQREIEAFASRFGISVIRDNSPAKEIVHNLRTAVIDSNGRLVTILRDTEWTPNEFVGELRKALGR